MTTHHHTRTALNTLSHIITPARTQGPRGGWPHSAAHRRGGGLWRCAGRPAGCKGPGGVRGPGRLAGAALGRVLRRCGRGGRAGGGGRSGGVTGTAGLLCTPCHDCCMCCVLACATTYARFVRAACRHMLLDRAFVGPLPHTTTPSLSPCHHDHTQHSTLPPCSAQHPAIMLSTTPSHLGHTHTHSAAICPCLPGGHYHACNHPILQSGSMAAAHHSIVICSCS